MPSRLGRDARSHLPSLYTFKACITLERRNVMASCVNLTPDIDGISHLCRAAEEAGSPVEKLEWALDGMQSMREPFCGRFLLGSAVDRRTGGQGVVQFADIAGTRDRACFQLYASH